MKPPLKRTMGSTWWLARGAYFRIMLRELTAVFIGAYLVFFLFLLYRIPQGADPYYAYMDFLGSPGMIVFHIVALASALMHTITWFNLTPQALVIRLGEEKLPPAMIAGPNYVVWAAVTAFVLWVVLG